MHSKDCFSVVVAAVLASTCPLAAQHQSDPLRAPSNGPRRVDPGWHVIRGATVHPEPGVILEDASVVIRGDRVVEVSDSPGWTAPPGARVWDATDLHVYAGFIDPFVEIDAPTPDVDLPGSHWNPKVTPHRRALDADGLPDATGKQLRELGFTAGMIAPKGGIFRGVASVVSFADDNQENTSSAPDRPATVVHLADVAHVVAFETFRGGRGRNPSDISYPNSQMGAIALMRQTLSDARWIDRQRDSDANALRTLNIDLPLMFTAGNELEVLRFAKVADEFDRETIIVGSGTEFRRLDAIAELDTPVILPLKYPETPKVTSISEAETVSLRTLLTWEQAPTNPRRLTDAGIRVALTSAKLKKRADFHGNLRKAIDDGLSEDDALAMLTINAASILDIDDRFGAIKAGYQANLVIADGNIFDTETKIRDLWIDGVRHEITPPPKPDLEGTWDVTVTPRVNEPTRLVVDDKGAITVEQDQADGETATSKAKKLVLRHDGQLSFVFDHAPFGDAGVMTLSGLVQGDAIQGRGTSPAGKAFSWAATRTTERPADGDASEDADEALAAGDDDAGEEASDPIELPGYPFGGYAMSEIPEQENVVLTNATIWTSGPDGRLERGTIYIADGKVQWLASSRRSVDGARTIDCSGWHITPGLIDCHSHTGLFQGGVNESGQSVTSEVRIGDITNPDAASWYRQLAGGVTTVNQLHGSANPIGGQSQTLKVRWGVEHPDEMHFDGAPTGIKFALGENVKQSNWGDRYRVRYPQTRMGVETLIRDRFQEAREYAAGMQRGEMRRPDLELQALAEILAGERLVHCHSYRQDEILMLCRVAHEFGFKIGTFQHVLEGYKVAEAIKEHARGGSAFSDWWAYKVEVQDAIPFNGAIMHDVGVVVSYNSDSDDLARRMNIEAAKAVKYGGVSPEEALKFVTINPAIQLGIEDRVGSLEKGKDADLVVWNGDPLSTFSRPLYTFVDGRELFSVDRDREHRAKIESHRQRVMQKLLEEAAGVSQDVAAADVASDEQDKEETAPTHRFARQMQEQVREYYLDLLRRGIDTESMQCGQCGVCTHFGVIR